MNGHLPALGCAGSHVAASAEGQSAGAGMLLGMEMSSCSTSKAEQEALTAPGAATHAWSCLPGC